ncbi:MAG: glycosyltransferase [Candidatus Gracilibacteria bacterium]
MDEDHASEFIRSHGKEIPKFTIGFQGWFLNQPYTGIGQHSLGLLRELALQKNIECIIPVPQKITPKGIPKNWLHVLHPKLWLLHPALKKWYWERIQVPTFFAQKKLDWEYYPYPSPLPPAGPHFRAITVHDLILWKDPRYKGNRLKSYYHLQARRSLIHADQLFTVSESVHDELGIPAAKVLPNGAAQIPAKLKKLNYQDALVYLGGYDIRKNVPEMVQTVATIKHPPRLVLIGQSPHQSRYYPAVPEYPYTYPLGFLPDEEVYSVLKSSFAFVNFSDSEGFNIPLLQAMTVGIPAIVRDLPVNREISNNAALFLPDTHSKSSLRQALSDKLILLEDPTQRKNIIAAQKKAAARYSWKKSLRIFLNQLSRSKHAAR